MQMHNTIALVVKFVESMIRPEQIIAFGSIAEQRHNRYSDLDLIVVVNDVENRNYYAELLESFIQRLSLKSDILIHSIADINAAEKYSFLAEAVEGVIIIYG